MAVEKLLLLRQSIVDVVIMRVDGKTFVLLTHPFNKWLFCDPEQVVFQAHKSLSYLHNSSGSSNET